MLPALPPVGGILALDLSSHVGWAYGRLKDRAPYFGVWRLPSIGGEGARYAAFENELGDTLEAVRPHQIVLEAPLPLPALNNFRAAAQQYGLRAIAYAEGWRMKAMLSEIDALTARAEVIGQRRFSRDVVKREVVRFCYSRGCKVPDHNAADACILWWWITDRLNERPPCHGPLWRRESVAGREEAAA